MLFVDFEFCGGYCCKDIAAVIISHIFDWRHEQFPIIVIIILKFCYFLKIFEFGQRGDYLIELLELWFGKVGELVEAFFKAFV